MPFSKKLLIIATGLGIFFVGVWIGYISGVNSVGKGNDSFVGEYKVVKVIDGDTIEIESGQRVRYIGMDAPEEYDVKTPVCYAKEAAAKNRELVEGKIVRLEKDISDKDKYGRLLRYVYSGEDFINLNLVQLGFAKAANFPPDEKFKAEFSAAESQAKKNKAGLWTACE